MDIEYVNILRGGNLVCYNGPHYWLGRSSSRRVGNDVGLPYLLFLRLQVRIRGQANG